MKRNNIFCSLAALALVFTVVFLGSTKVFAHCDGMDGPVVIAAKKALETGDMNLVLIWVQQKDEGEIKRAFNQTLAVRKLSPEARELADTYFFENLVRIHRSGEGAPYTGLKPAGRDLGPAIPAGDKALLSGSVEPVVKLLTEVAKEGIREQFNYVMSKKNFAKDDVEAGREYVEAYVTYIHYLEGLYEAAKQPAHGHFREVDKGEAHRH